MTIENYFYVYYTSNCLWGLMFMVIFTLVLLDVEKKFENWNSLSVAGKHSVQSPRTCTLYDSTV